MSKPFRGVINIDIKQSTPDWEPYTQPKAPDGAPNVLYIVLGADANTGQGSSMADDPAAAARP